MSARMRYRWLITDLDGTLLDEHQAIPERNRQALAAYRAAGGRVVLATGRNEAAVQRFVDALAITEPCILYNGCRVVDMTARRVLHEARLPDAATAALVTRDWEPELNPFFYTGEAAYIRRMTPTVAEHMEKDGIAPRLLAPGEAPQGSLIKVLIIGPPSRLNALGEAILATLDGVRLTHSEPDYLEVLPGGASKGSALRWLADHCGFTLDTTVAIGDNLNDLEMIATAGCGVAVANAHPALQAAARLRVGPGPTGGVAEALVQLGLI